MPYKIRKNAKGEQCVFKVGENKPIGCHATLEKARAQLAALYAAEPAARPSKSEVMLRCLMACHETLEACARCIAACRECENAADPAHVRCIAACEACVAACQACLDAADASGLESPECLAACVACEDACRTCAAACVECACACGYCSWSTGDCCFACCYCARLCAAAAPDAPEEDGMAAMKAGRRHSTKDSEEIQQIHDLTCSQGAKCSFKNVKTAGTDVEEPAVPDTSNSLGADNILVAFGTEVKALGEGRVGGYLVRFTDANNADLTGDYFDAKTDFGDFTESYAVYHHGMDKTLGKKRLANKAKIGRDTAGVWIEHQLDLRDDYEAMIYDLVEKKKLGWSSGTAAHLVERERVGKAYHITAWPLGLDASYTPTPADPGNVVSLKSLITPEQAGEPQTAPDGAHSLWDEMRREGDFFRQSVTYRME